MDTLIGFLPPTSVSLRSCAVLCSLSWLVFGAGSALAADTSDPASERAVAAASTLPRMGRLWQAWSLLWTSWIYLCQPS
jgi:hypothetical protein